MTLNHPRLVKSLQTAYSAEKAASFAYIGHAGSLRDPNEKAAVRQIEQDEWDHRRNVLKILNQYDIPISKYMEIKYHIIGKAIGYSCYVIGRFMPYFFAGKLESGNVCEYFVMLKMFHSLGITEHDEMLYEMGIREKEHEVYFLNTIKDAKWLPLFERVFSWGANSSLNDVNLDDKNPRKMRTPIATIMVRIEMERPQQRAGQRIASSNETSWERTRRFRYRFGEWLTVSVEGVWEAASRRKG